MGRREHLLRMTFGDRIRRLEDQKAAMVAEVSAWPEEVRSWRPADGGWTALQVLDHLVRTETGICGVATKRFEQPVRIGLRDRVGFKFVHAVFRTRRRVKVPESVGRFINPGQELELAEIVSRWDVGREELARLAAHVEQAACRGGLFKHPVSGWISFEQMLRFFSVHLLHHEFQLERIWESAGQATSRWR